MSVSQKLANLRSKPQHVRERYLLLIVAIAAPVLFTLWYATLNYDLAGSTLLFVKNVGSSVSRTFANSPFKSDTPASTPPQ